jgi:hypothetical protein
MKRNLVVSRDTLDLSMLVSIYFAFLVCVVDDPPKVLFPYQNPFFVFTFAVDINPNGRCYASGAEDGYVRLHFFDKDYLDMTDPVPEADEEEKTGE